MNIIKKQLILRLKIKKYSLIKTKIKYTLNNLFVLFFNKDY